MKKLAAIILSAIMCISLASCGSKDDIPEIGLLQLMEHPALTATRLGIIQALEDNGYIDGETVKLDIQVASNDQSILGTVADRFVGNDVDLIIAIATPSTQAVAGKTSTIPILGSAITNFEFAGLVDSNSAPGRNISGVSDLTPIASQLDLIFKFVPNAQVIGFAYNSAEDNSRYQIGVAKEYVESLGLTWREVTVATSNDVAQAITDLADRVDAIYLPNDNTMAGAMALVSSIATAAKVPVVVADRDMVYNGGLVTLGINYFNVGYETGLMAVKILRDGGNPASMPIQFSTEFNYFVNGRIADELGITVPDEFTDYIFYE